MLDTVNAATALESAALAAGLPAGTTTTKERYTPAQMLIWARWACAEISFYHAQTASIEFDGDGATYAWALPPNVVDSIERTGLVALKDGITVSYLRPIREIASTIFPIGTGANVKGFIEWPSGVLSLGFVPSNNQKIIVSYFKVWDPPVDDNSILDFPHWMEQPYAYLIAANAMNPFGTVAAQVRQWNQRQDSGHPEDNPLNKQSRFFLDQAMRLLARAGVQDREKFYRVGPR